MFLEDYPHVINVCYILVPLAFRNEFKLPFFNENLPPPLYLSLSLSLIDFYRNETYVDSTKKSTADEKIIISRKTLQCALDIYILDILNISDACPSLITEREVCTISTHVSHHIFPQCSRSIRSAGIPPKHLKSSRREI